MQRYALHAVHLADEVEIRDFRAQLEAPCLYATTSELFVKVQEESFMQLFNYGVVVFINMPPELEQEYTSRINPFLKVTTNFPNHPKESHEVIYSEGSGISFDFGSLTLPEFSYESLRITSLHLAQSVAIHYYANLAESLLNQLQQFSDELALRGRLRISHRDMLRFVGTSLKIQNSIQENLYIFDVPPVVWEDEKLNKLNKGLVEFFELGIRYRQLEQMGKVIQDNLEVYRDLYQHRESKQLEWVIIILILVEVVDAFLGKW